MSQSARNTLPAHAGIGRCHEMEGSDQGPDIAREQTLAELHRRLDARVTPKVIEAMRNPKNLAWFDDQIEVILCRIVQIGRS